MKAVSYKIIITRKQLKGCLITLSYTICKTFRATVAVELGKVGVPCLAEDSPQVNLTAQTGAYWRKPTPPPPKRGQERQP